MTTEGWICAHGWSRDEACVPCDRVTMPHVDEIAWDIDVYYQRKAAAERAEQRAVVASGVPARQPGDLVTVTLTPEVKARLLEMAQARQALKIDASSRKRDTAWSELSVHYLGLKGEYVVSAAMGLPFQDESFGVHGDSGVDIMVGGVPCAIKTRHLRHGDHVIGERHDLDRVERVIFVQGTCTKQRCLCRTFEPGPELWTYAGWMTVADFWAQATEDDWGYGPRWWVPQRVLNTSVFHGG